MADLIIERTDRFRIVSHGNGAAYTFDNLVTGESLFIQYGDGAAAFRAEYEAMEAAHANPTSAWHVKPWDKCLAHLFSVA